MPKLEVHRRGYALGAEITGVDARKALDDETVAAIRRAVLDHIVVCLPGQNLGADDFIRFSGHFGELDVPNTHVPHRHPDHPALYIAVNQALAVNGKQAVTTPPMTHWHFDFSQTEQPATLTFLHAQALPPIGGDTMFANLYMAYEALSPAFKRMIDQLWEVHDFHATRPFIAHPLVRVHPETGRKALCLVERMWRLAGMTVEESAPLVDFLKAHATRYEFVYRHRWTVKDLLIWDNRCSIHAVVPDFDQSQLRSMLRCSLVGPKVGRVYTEGMELALS
jgi:taurine dioxygenase